MIINVSIVAKNDVNDFSEILREVQSLTDFSEYRGAVVQVSLETLDSTTKLHDSVIAGKDDPNVPAETEGAVAKVHQESAKTVVTLEEKLGVTEELECGPDEPA